ncbi:hypothetical protein EYF80_045249 [Liparis tanakae]|uniref:Uncharacterized protein n=1 Tax=Liparis tanakae TaxID=230148 RepID=A0A4Z2FTH5_9TELE|nr:hypothetical protein EYF80_045249 [Liparis tanakae]
MADAAVLPVGSLGQTSGSERTDRQRAGAASRSLRRNRANRRTGGKFRDSREFRSLPLPVV